jgi:hypothetical protein
MTTINPTPDTYTVPDNPTDLSPFGAIVSAWNEQVRCEMTTKAGARCRRPAYWRINLHNCEQALACGQHTSAWARSAMANIGSGLSPRCAHCGRTFDSISAAYSVTPL